MKNEPVLTVGIISAVIVALLAALGIIVDINTVSAIVVIAIPLVADIIKRTLVTPVSKTYEELESSYDADRPESPETPSETIIVP
jgi:hypothetical protein